MAAGAQARAHRVEVDPVRRCVDDHVGAGKRAGLIVSGSRPSICWGRLAAAVGSAAARRALRVEVEQRHRPTSSEAARSAMIAGAIVPPAPRTATRSSWGLIRAGTVADRLSCAFNAVCAVM